MDQKQTLLHHFLAALAYRTQKALRGAPAEFASFRAAPKVRTPHELIRHMDDVLGYSGTFSSAVVIAHRCFRISKLLSSTSIKRSRTSHGTLSRERSFEMRLLRFCSRAPFP